MIRVEATFKDSRKSVASRRIDGKAERSSGFMIYMPTSRITSEKVMLNDSSKSSINGGIGMIMNTRIPTTATAMKMSVFLDIRGTAPA